MRSWITQIPNRTALLLFCFKSFSYWAPNATERQYFKMDLLSTQSKYVKTYVEKVSDLIINGRIRLCQLSEIDPAEAIVPYTNAQIMSLWVIDGKELITTI